MRALCHRRPMFAGRWSHVSRAAARRACELVSNGHIVVSDGYIGMAMTGTPFHKLVCALVLECFSFSNIIKMFQQENNSPTSLYKKSLD